jgi:hypothetical protein
MATSLTLTLLLTDSLATSLSRYAVFYNAIDYHATEIDIFDTGLAQTRDCELPPGAEILIVFFSNTSILSHTPAIEELI